MVYSLSKSRKAQLIGEIFKYAIVLVLASAVIVMGYRFIGYMKDRACKSELTKFQIDFSNIDKDMRQGEKELRSYSVPCNVDRVYLFDVNKSINPDSFNGIPIIKDSLKSGSDKNVFLIKEGKVLGLFYAGNMEIDNPYYICFSTVSGRINFFVEGLGKSVKVTSEPEQKLCS